MTCRAIPDFGKQARELRRRPVGAEGVGEERVQALLGRRFTLEGGEADYAVVIGMLFKAISCR